MDFEHVYIKNFLEVGDNIVCILRANSDIELAGKVVVKEENFFILEHEQTVASSINARVVYHTPLLYADVIILKATSFNVKDQQ